MLRIKTSRVLKSLTDSGFVCDCDPEHRSACAGEEFYRELNGKSYCVLHFPSNDKTIDFKPSLQRKLEAEEFDFRGVWFPEELHLVQFKFNDKVDFSGATFGGTANFQFAVFEDSVNFSSAVFLAGARFRRASFQQSISFYFCRFTSAEFIDAIFSDYTFFTDAAFSEQVSFESSSFEAEAEFTGTFFQQNVSFDRTRFNGSPTFFSTVFNECAFFSWAVFSKAAEFNQTRFKSTAHFYGAQFRAQVDFHEAVFSGFANFNNTSFGDLVSFSGSTTADYSDTATLEFHFATIEKSDKVSFHTLTLRPYWFVNIDARKFGFTNVEWHWRSTREEIADLELRRVSSSHRMLSIACRNLAVNAEENHRYEEASRFRYMAMDASRLEHWKGFDFRRLSWWYWLASGYGERVWRAAVVLLCLLLVCAALYTRAGFARWEPRITNESETVTAQRDEVGAPLRLSRALAYSAAVLTFQRPEPRPATTTAQTIVVVETILGPVQAALLALAIRRKFMR